jgi:hypothetical protein
MALICAESGLVNLDKATPTNYQLVFPVVPTETTISAMNPLTLNIFSTVLPGVSFGETEFNWESNKTKRATAPMMYENWNVNFVVDSLFENWRVLLNWMKFINNNNDKIAELHKEYSVDASFIITDNYRSPILNVTFRSVWPISVGAVNLSQREGDVQIESQADFVYDYFDIEER